MSGNKCPLCRSQILDSFLKKEMDVDAYVQSQRVVYESMFSNLFENIFENNPPEQHLRMSPPDVNIDQ